MPCTASRMTAAACDRVAGHAHQHAAGEAARLPQRAIDLRDRVAVEPERLDVADDADDGRPRSGRCRPTPPRRSDRGPPTAAHHRLVDDDDRRRVLVIELGEAAAAHEPACRACRSSSGWRRGRRRSAAPPACRRCVPAIWKRVCPGCRPASGTPLVTAAPDDAGRALEPLEQRHVKPAQRLRRSGYFVKLPKTSADITRSPRIAGIDALQAIEAEKQQAGADQQHDRHRHLRDDQRALNGGRRRRRWCPCRRT